MMASVMRTVEKAIAVRAYSALALITREVRFSLPSHLLVLLIELTVALGVLLGSVIWLIYLKDTAE
jgi:hypothetical protein